MLYFCTINHGNFSFLSKDVISPLDLQTSKTTVFRIHYTVKLPKCQSLKRKIDMFLSTEMRPEDGYIADLRGLLLDDLHEETTVRLPISPILHFDEKRH